jgi:hypothetical protein
MRVDHVAYAAEADGLKATAKRLAKKLGVKPVDGGVHPRFGTRNMIFPLASGRYVEVVAVLDHPASDKAPFGQAVRACSDAGGGWLGWVVSVSDLPEAEQRLGREAVVGSRHRPDGVVLKWRQLGIKGLLADPEVPFYIQWDDMKVHPSVGATTDVSISGLQIAGDPRRVTEWLGRAPEETSSTIKFDFVAPHGTPGLLSVTFDTPKGPITI